MPLITEITATPVSLTPLEDAMPQTTPYISAFAQRFAPGNFVTDGTSDKVGVTRAIADVTEANPLVLVKWISDLTEEWVRSEYLYRATDEVAQ